ncbi:MAG TPA: hypothetical protein VGS79_18960 [Puia sp.]|nr:hypothetical protein [Puia sp.]
MEQKHLDFLNNALKYLGFGENTLLNRELEEHIALGEQSFELETEVSYDGVTRLSAQLFFSRSKNKLYDFYFFNKYKVQLHDPAKKGEKAAQKMFYIQESRLGVTLKQAYNLLQGRYVQRKIVDQNGETYLRWLFLEPKLEDTDGFAYLRQIKQQFDLDKALDIYPIPGLNSREIRERICSSLRRGNLHPVTIAHESGKSQDLLLYANPINGVISNIVVATGARQKKGKGFEITELPELEHPSGDPIKESTLEEEPSKARKRAHL